MPGICAYMVRLEREIRDRVAVKDFDRIKKIIQQLCNDYAYAVNQPHARNGGLIGLAAAAIALGMVCLWTHATKMLWALLTSWQDLARYLAEIVPPVLACFTDQDARVRYYACESMYNIAKVAKGEVLPYFNEIFDALCKVSPRLTSTFPLTSSVLISSQLGADSELSVKNGAELLDRLIKDIVSESAATYVSILQPAEELSADAERESQEESIELPAAFSLARFIPLLKERVQVVNPFTRTFLVGWIALLDSIPELELVSYLPEFLSGLFKFLSDPNKDVHVATQGALEKFLGGIKRIARIKKGLEESRKSRSDRKHKRSSSAASNGSMAPDTGLDDDSVDEADEKSLDSDYWVPGQDALIHYKEIIEVLTNELDSSLGKSTILRCLACLHVR